MKKNIISFLSAAIFVYSAGVTNVYARSGDSKFLDYLRVEHEFGPLVIFQNDGRYGETGTKYTASDVGQDRNLFPSSRTSFELGFRERHRLIILYAPLDVTTNVLLDKDIQFKDTLFASGTLVEHRYLFEGLRASYLYEVFSKEQTTLDLGGTIQIRNAEVSFRDTTTGLFETENDIGIVFALKGRIRHYPGDSGNWIQFEADGFSTFGLLGDSVSGAIYDLRLLWGLPIATGADLIIGGRVIGGGAEVERRNIENWGNYGSLTVGLQLDLLKVLGSK